MSDYKRQELMWQIERSRADAQHHIVVILAVCWIMFSLCDNYSIRVIASVFLYVLAIVGTYYVRMSNKTPAERDQ